MFLHQMQKDFRLSPFGRNSHVPGGQATVHPTDNFMLFESLSFMNVSGQPCKKLWQWLQKTKSAKYDPKLLILHDELELPIGKIKYRPESQKVNGHNGLRDIKMNIPEPTARIAIGIDRPDGRESKMVANYVLSQFTQQQRRTLMEEAYPDAVSVILDILDRKSL